MPIIMDGSSNRCGKKKVDEKGPVVPVIVDGLSNTRDNSKVRKKKRQ